MTDQPGGSRVTEPTPPERLATRASELLSLGYRMALVAAHEDPDSFRIVYLFIAARPDRRTELVVRTSLKDPCVPTLARISFPAGRFEREIRDMYGIVPLDHPLPHRLVRHQHWPQGWYPMRSDAADPPPFGSTDVPYPFVTVKGRGVYEIPVGPVHAGIIEPGHFRLSVVGETVLKLKVRLWFAHKGIEKLVEGRSVEQAYPVAERISGDTTVGHSLAFCLAVEQALGWQVSDREGLLRAMLLEMERLYNHVTDIGALCNDAGHGLLDALALTVREELLQLNAAVTGHRLLRGAITPGGAAVLSLPDVTQIRAVAVEVADIVELALTNTLVRDRFTSTAVLKAQQVEDLGALGYAGRASGVDRDARRDHPFHPATTTVAAVVETGGDVLARFLVRAGEVQASTELLAELLSQLSDQASDQASDQSGPGAAGEVLLPGTRPARVPPLPSAQVSGVGLVEGWRGTIAHRVEIRPDGTLARLKIVDPSFFNWPAVPVAMKDTIVPDFPLVNKSFNLSYAGNDL